MLLNFANNKLNWFTVRSWVNGKPWYRVVYSKYGDHSPSATMTDDPFDVDHYSPDENGWTADDVTTYHPNQFGWTQEMPDCLND